MNGNILGKKQDGVTVGFILFGVALTLVSVCVSSVALFPVVLLLLVTDILYSLFTFWLLLCWRNGLPFHVAPLTLLLSLFFCFLIIFLVCVQVVHGFSPRYFLLCLTLTGFLMPTMPIIIPLIISYTK